DVHDRCRALHQPRFRHIRRLNCDLGRAFDWGSVHPGTRTVVSVENPIPHRRTGNVDDAGGVDTEGREMGEVGPHEVVAPSRHQTHGYRPKTCTERGVDGTTTEA